MENFSRLERSTSDLINLVSFFKTKKVKLVNIKENLDTIAPQVYFNKNSFSNFYSI
ncbi:recombinase family protein [Carnobacterium maltaromaticum]